MLTFIERSLTCIHANIEVDFLKLYCILCRNNIVSCSVYISAYICKSKKCIN